MRKLAKREQTGIEVVQDTDHEKKFSVRGFIVKNYASIQKSYASIEKNLFILLILGSVSLDPLFFYIPIVNDNSKCLTSDNNLRIILVVFRTFCDGAYLVLWWRQRLWPSFFCKEQFKIGRFMIAGILATLPLPQVVVYATSWRMLTVKLLKFLVLIQFVPRIFSMIWTYNYARKRTFGSIRLWSVAAFLLSLFVLASHVLGAFWYLRVIERNMECWRKACKIRTLCDVSSFYCDGSLGNNKYIDEFCPIPPDPNSKFFDHGIYLDGFQRDIISMRTKFLNKLFYCCWWGLQSFSSLGQNLKPGTYTWDNFFAIFIVITGLVLLALLIGNMQVYLQSQAASDVKSELKKRAEEERTQRAEEERKRAMEEQKRAEEKWKQERKTRIKKELWCWKPFKSFPDSLRKEVMSCENEEWLRTTEINLETFLNKIQPRQLRRQISQELSKNLFSRVEKFEELNPQVKQALREQANPVIFQARSIIYTEGYPIDTMFHIVEGKLLAFTRDSYKKEESRTRSLKSDDSLGIELLNKALESSEPILPLSTETLQTFTKVEAFALTFDDIFSVFNRYGSLIPSYQKTWAPNDLESVGASKKKAANMKEAKFFP